MVISVFPDVSQGFARYEQSRRGRLQDQALRTQNNMMQRRQAAFQDMVAGLEGQEQQIAEVMGPDYVAYAAQRDAARQAAEQEAAAAAQEGYYENYDQLLPRYAVRYQNAETDEQRQQVFNAAAEQMSLFARREGYQGFNPEVLERELASYAPEPQRAPQRAPQRGINPSTGREEYFREGANGEIEWINVQAPPRGSETADLVRETLGGLFPYLREGELARYDLGRLESADQRASAARTVLSTVSRLEGEVGERGSSEGVLGWVRNAGAGFIDQLDELASFGEDGARIANTVRQATRLASDGLDPRGETGLRSETFSEFFDSDLGGVSYLTSTLAYMIVQMRDPGGRVSDADFRTAVNNLGGGPFGSTEKLESALRQVRLEAEDQLRAAAETRRDVRGGGLGEPRDAPAPIDPNAPLDDLISQLLPD